MMPSLCANIRRLLTVLVLFQAVPLQAKEEFLLSGNPIKFPNPASSKLPSLLDGDLTIEKFTENQFSVYSPEFEKLDFYRRVVNVTGSVIIRQMSVVNFDFFSHLKNIGGDLKILDCPQLERIDFLNNVVVKGSIEGGSNNTQFCLDYSYLVTVNEKYANLFDDSCITKTGDVNILEMGAMLGTKKRITGSLKCNLTENPNSVGDRLLLMEIPMVISVGSLIFDNCPVDKLSGVFLNLKRVETTIHIVNCSKLVDNEFSDWLHGISTNYSNMIIKNNENVCLKADHMAEWKKKNATISEVKECGVLIGDINLAENATMLSDVTKIHGKMICKDYRDKVLPPNVISFLKKIRYVESLEFENCHALSNFSYIFNETDWPHIKKINITNCPYFVTDFNIKKLANQAGDSIFLANNPNACFMENDFDNQLRKENVKQKEFCGKTCNGGRVAYRRGVMKSNIGLSRDCDKISGELLFEGELPSADEVKRFANIRAIEGSLYFNGIKNEPVTNKTFDLLPNLKKIDFKDFGEKFPQYGCAVTILNVKLIDNFIMKSLEEINCNEAEKKCICMEGNTEYEKTIMQSDDWPAVKMGQTNVVVYPQNVIDCNLYAITDEKYSYHVTVCIISLLMLNTILIATIFFKAKFEKADDKKGNSKEKEKEKEKSGEKEKSKEKEEEKEQDKGEDKGKERKEKKNEEAKEAVVQSGTEPSLSEKIDEFTLKESVKEPLNKSKNRKKNSKLGSQKFFID